MTPVLINGFLYWVGGWKNNRIYNEDKSSFTYYFYLTSNEKIQVYNCLFYDVDKQRVIEYIKKNKIT